MEASLAPHRCFCGEVTSEQHQRGKLRVLGTLVSLTPLAVPREDDAQSEEPYTHSLVLQDDETTTTATTEHPNQTTPPLLASHHMAKAVQEGQTVDCIVHVVRQRPGTGVDTNANTATDTVHLIIDTLIIMPNGAQAKSLRRMEIQHQRKGFPGRTWGLTQPSLKGQDINDIIQAEPDVGVRIDDLMDMFVIEDRHALQAMIEDLQMQGLIYQSKSGAYLPL